MPNTADAGPNPTHAPSAPEAKGGGRGNKPVLVRKADARPKPGRTQSKSPRRMNYPLLLKQVRRKRGLTKEQFHTLKRAVKAQCRTLRKVKRKPEEEELLRADHMDPWAQRLPNMHEFFYTRNPKLDRKMETEARKVVSDPNLFFTWLGGHMAKLPAHSFVIDVPQLEALVRALGRPSNLKEFLKGILRNKSLVEEIASRSYHQDLFDKLVLLSGKDWKLRMHIFEAATFSQAQEEIHSHRDHFVSYCVHGGISQQIWEEIDAPEAKGVGKSDEVQKDQKIREQAPVYYHKYAYDPTTKDGTRVFRVKDLGRVALGPVDEEQISTKGRTYYMHPSVLHSVEGIEGKTVTLVLNRRATTKSCFASPARWEEQFVRTKISPSKLSERIEQVLKLMETPGEL